MKEWLSRQSFLGSESDAILSQTTLGIVGLGGGGSHTVQQAAHIGIGKFVLTDPQVFEDTNLNRLVGAVYSDIKKQTPKVDIAERLILGIQPEAQITKRQEEWQAVSDDLLTCDVIIGCLDSVRAKSELEAFCRRFLIPYIDMGMDVHSIEESSFLISGQVILSLPDTPCLKCYQIVTDEGLEKEGVKYGDAGGLPQVVWPNGVLASSAIGLLVQLITPWYGQQKISTYLEYDGNANTIHESRKVGILEGRKCSHYKADDVGDVVFNIQRPPKDKVIINKKKTTWWKRIFNHLYQS